MQWPKTKENKREENKWLEHSLQQQGAVYFLNLNYCSITGSEFTTLGFKVFPLNQNAIWLLLRGINWPNHLSECSRFLMHRLDSFFSVGALVSSYQNTFYILGWSIRCSAKNKCTIRKSKWRVSGFFFAFFFCFFILNSVVLSAAYTTGNRYQNPLQTSLKFGQRCQHCSYSWTHWGGNATVNSISTNIQRK